jgi:hypothetical protein
VPPEAWRTPEELFRVGFAGERVVMANEAHDGLARCARTRAVGRRLVAAADAVGVRRLAMEALVPGFAAAANDSRRLPDEAPGYLAQQDMRALIHAAVDRGWPLWPYEADHAAAPADLRADPMGMAYTDWREGEQARRLVAALAELGPDERLLVWYGNGHALKITFPGTAGGGGDREWVPMGVRFARLAGAGAFVVDQTVTVRFAHRDPRRHALVEELRPVLERLGGTAGRSGPTWSPRGGRGPARTRSSSRSTTRWVERPGGVPPTPRRRSRVYAADTSSRLIRGGAPERRAAEWRCPVRWTRMVPVPNDTGEIVLSKRELREVAGYAAESAQEVLGIFERAHPADSRPREAADAAWTFARGGERGKALRDAAWAALRAARDAGTAAAGDGAGGGALDQLEPEHLGREAPHGEVRAGDAPQPEQDAHQRVAAGRQLKNAPDGVRRRDGQVDGVHLAQLEVGQVAIERRHRADCTARRARPPAAGPGRAWLLPPAGAARRRV